MRKFLIAAAIFMIVYGCWHAYSVFLEYQTGRKLYEDISEQFITLQDSGKENIYSETEKDISEIETFAGKAERNENHLPDDAPEKITVDWEGLKAINEDIVAWLQLPAVNISYPVVQGKDNSYYLHRSIEKKELFSGCLFMDMYNSSNLDNFNTIIYGHNMRDGSMFAKLKEYIHPETWSVCPYFWVYTELGDYLYRIFSVHKAEVNGTTFTVRFADTEFYTNWLQSMIDNSSVSGEVELTCNDKVMTLSTCTTENEMRQVLQGVLIYQSL